MKIRYLLSFFWVALAALWVSAFAFLGQMGGGIQWIAHMGWLRQAIFDLAMAALCLVGAVITIKAMKYPKPFVIAFGLGVALHLVGAIVAFVLYETNGHVSRQTFVVFYYLSTTFATNSNFIGQPPGNLSLLMLPSISAVILAIALAGQPASVQGQEEVEGAEDKPRPNPSINTDAAR